MTKRAVTLDGKVQMHEADLRGAVCTQEPRGQRQQIKKKDNCTWNESMTQIIASYC